jgi:hypothetical protein
MFKFRKPLANPPAACWRYDLPGPNDAPATYPYPPVMSHAPNHMNEVFLELPREEIMNRSFIAYTAIPCIAMLLLLPVMLIVVTLLERELPPFMLVLSLLLVVPLGMWVFIYYWRIAMESPVDQPIRFNRARRKVYIYRFHHSGRHLFSNIGWGVKPVAYHWDDLHAEFCGTYGAMGAGGVIENVSLAVLEPRTHKVIDRFLFAHRSHEAEMYWAMVQIFMQQGPQALPAFEKPPRDWNNEEHFFNFARRFAPKVKWPEDMDLESRTAPFSINN